MDPRLHGDDIVRTTKNLLTKRRERSRIHNMPLNQKEIITVVGVITGCAAGIATYYYGLRPLFRKIRFYLDSRDVQNMKELADKMPLVSDHTPRSLRKKIENADKIVKNWAINPDQKRPK